MKKAPWLLASRLALSKPVESDTDELARYHRLGWLGRRTPIRSEQERLYSIRVRQWLSLPQNRVCRVFMLLQGRQVRATQCHHYQGRRGMLLLYEPFWIPVSFAGHRWIDDHRQRARELGLLCPLGRYNSAVRTG